MQQIIPENIKRLLKELKIEVKRDSWNLARDDHDAIEIRIDQLEQFIAKVYADRKHREC